MRNNHKGNFNKYKVKKKIMHTMFTAHNIIKPGVYN